MNKLSKKGEDLLNEILDHRDVNGNCDTEYWKGRFESLSLAEDVILRSLFKELIEKEMIAAKWADNYPYLLFVLANGISYFEEIEMIEVEESGSYVNNFFCEVNGVQIQQGSINSSQTQTNKFDLNRGKINELIEMIHKYDLVLDSDYGVENANNIRNSANELSVAVNKHNKNKAKWILNYIRDLSVNASGGLIAAGIVQLINNIVE